MLNSMSGAQQGLPAPPQARRVRLTADDRRRQLLGIGLSKLVEKPIQDLSIDDNLSSGQLPGNAQIETLPPDEGSTTPSNQLQNGYDNPDVNDLGNSD